MSEYLKIVMRNLEPVRFSDASASQSGQTMTLRYIPGTVIRGWVINALAAEPDFAQIKQMLFSSRVRYLNAFLTDQDGELLPSPKGFYEDKTTVEGKKELNNVVVDGQFQEGYKRAALGRFCRIQGDCICYCQTDTGSDLKIKRNVADGEEQKVFRKEYISAGHVFTGYVAVDAEPLKDRIRSVFGKEILIGSGRSAGLGKCEILSCDWTDRLPYGEYLAKEDQTGSCYLMLVSDTAMRGANGEPCGLNLEKLGEQMGVKELTIRYCSASTVTVKGYNRVWHAPVPSVMMYEQGSVFHLEYIGTLTRDKMYTICDQGIGIRTGEGFGRVLFLDHYDKIRYKQAVPYPLSTVRKAQAQKMEGDDGTLQIAAKGFYRGLVGQALSRYVVSHPLKAGKISDSQLGTVESFACAYKYDPQEAKLVLERYLGHAQDKAENNRVQKKKGSMKELGTFISRIFGTELEELLDIHTAHAEHVMGIPKRELFTDDEKDRIRLELIIRMIRYYKKEGEC